MAEEQNKATEYETTFTKNNVFELSNEIAKAVNEYAKEHGDTGKVDIFVLLAALGHVGFEAGMKILTKDEEHATKVHKEMQLVSKDLLVKLDAIHLEHKTTASADLIGISHTLSVVSEYYANRRDTNIKKLIQDKAQEEVAVTGEGE